MTIAEKYELLQPIASSGFRSFRARHIQSRQDVMLHFLDPTAKEENNSILALLARLDATGRSQFLDDGEYEGSAYLVTQPLADFVSLRQWLESGTGAPVAQPAEPPAAASEPAVVPRQSDSGEFHKYFGNMPQPGPAEPPPAPLADTPVPEAPRGSGTGEFTRFFGGAAPPAPPVVAPMRAPVPDPPSRAPGSGPGEFTMLFGEAGPAAKAPAPSPARPAAADPPPRAPNWSGATGAFQAYKDPPPPERTPAAPQGPGEFTMILQGRPDAGSAPAAFPPPASAAKTGLPFPVPAVQAPSVRGPSISGMSLSGPSVNPGSVPVPTVHTPSLQAPSVRVPSGAAPARPAWKMIAATVLGCAFTLAVIGVIYVLAK